MTFASTDIASLYANEHARLKRILVRKGMSPQGAADAVQEAFMRLLRTPRDDIRDLRSYLQRTAETVAIDFHRQETRVAKIVDTAAPVDVAIADPHPLADALMICREEAAALDAALQELPPRCREVLLLHKFEGLSYGAIAERLGISKNTVMVHMVKAVAHLKSRLRANNMRRD